MWAGAIAQLELVAFPHAFGGRITGKTCGGKVSEVRRQESIRSTHCPLSCPPLLLSPALLDMNVSRRVEGGDADGEWQRCGASASLHRSDCSQRLILGIAACICCSEIVSIKYGMALKFYRPSGNFAKQFSGSWVCLRATFSGSHRNSTEDSFWR